MKNNYVIYECQKCGRRYKMPYGREGLNCSRCRGPLIPIMEKEQKESRSSIVIDVSMNKKHLKRVQAMCDKISNAIDEYIKADEEHINTETVTDSNGDVVAEFIDNRFNNVK